MKSYPDYHRIFNDIIIKKCPEKQNIFKEILSKPQLSALDILEINRKIFGISDKETERFNQLHRSYNEESILVILNYQKRHNLSNNQLAKHFKISRNSVAKWKKLFP